MKSRTYRTLRAQETATRDFCAGLSVKDNPFPEGTLERRVYTAHMLHSERLDREAASLYAAHSTPMPTRRDPATITIRPPLQGCA